MTEITLTFAYKEDEIVKPVRHYMLHSRVILTRSIFVIIFSIITFYYLLILKNILYGGIIAALLICILTGKIITYYYGPIYWFKKKPKLHGERKLIISEEGIYSEIKDFVTNHYDWRYYKKFTEADTYFLLWTSQGSSKYLIIPKRVFESKEQEESFKELVTRKLKS